MSTKDAYKQKLEAELEMVQAKLAKFEAPAKSPTVDVRIKHAGQVDNLKRKVDITKTQLPRLGEANKEVWDLLRYCF